MNTVKEMNYEFRKRLLEVHKPERRDLDISPSENEVLIDERWEIVIPEDTARALKSAAKDLQDYLRVSMGVSLRLRIVDDITPEIASKSRKIILTNKRLSPEYGKGLDTHRSYRLICTDESILICGFNCRGAAQGSYYLEDLMNLKCAPIVEKNDVSRKPVFSPRMIHSGYGLDMFPDSHLNAIAHAGMDAILIFTKDVDTTPHGYVDFNELIYRAEGYGIDVYAYSYLKSLKHPDDPDAENHYSGTYGKLFEKCPGLKGIVMVGESVEFPSKDPNTSGKFYYENFENGLPTGKPSPGWWPCNDYPQWLDMIKKVIRTQKEDADIVFWTYNWGYVDKEHRIELLKNIPTDISLLVTFEMFEKIPVDGIMSTCVDYTLSFEGPGQYFTSEAKIAGERGIRLYTMCNTGGLTWDIGVIPYEPCPYQWMRRHTGLHEANKKWGLQGLMESHHFGWWPSFISEAAKWSYWTESPDEEKVLELIAERDFGKENVSTVTKAWKYWSEGIRYYVSTNEDQYGPFRIGPSYPLVFRAGASIPTVPYAHFGGNKICSTNYASADSGRSSLFQFRLPVEKKRLEKMRSLFDQGVKLLEGIYSSLSENKKTDAFYMINLGKFIVNCVTTTLHVKDWALLKMKLMSETDVTKLREYGDAMIQIGRDEIENARNTIPLVEADSRLGWEPSMEYMTDTDHIQWKIKQVTRVLEVELPGYLSALKYNE
ncbi:MAG TPA: hypothetical protein DDZ89_14940 [Clostridiales bacterium]|nr:hypothetical protein [Clostridiales bacterium]